MKILIIEDDQRLAENCKRYLEHEHYQVDVATDGRLGLLKAKSNPYAVILLDWMLPGKDGIEILKELRQENVATPVIITTAKAQLEDKLEGFSQGTDDYLTKPFTLTELTARIAAIIRRTYVPENKRLITIYNMTVNLDSTAVTIDEKTINLTPTEYGILEVLLLHLGKVVSRADIMHHVWQDDVNQFTNHVEVHIKNLRHKLAEHTDREFIKTVKGRGYLIEELT